MPRARQHGPRMATGSTPEATKQRPKLPPPITVTIYCTFLAFFLHLIFTMDDQETSSAFAQVGWNFIVLMSRQGKIRLSEFFSSYAESEKRRILRDIAGDILPRAPKMCNIIEKGTYKFVYRRYASLYFVVGVPLGMNELIVLEQIHLFVEALDGYFNSGKVICFWRFVFTMDTLVDFLKKVFLQRISSFISFSFFWVSLPKKPKFVNWI